MLKTVSSMNIKKQLVKKHETGAKQSDVAVCGIGFYRRRSWSAF